MPSLVLRIAFVSTTFPEKVGSIIITKWNWCREQFLPASYPGVVRLQPEWNDIFGGAAMKKTGGGCENGWDRTIALDNDILSHVPLMWQHLVNCHMTHFPTEVWRQVDALHLEQSSTEMIASRSNACFKPCPRRASKGCVWKWVYPKCNFNGEDDDKPSTLGYPIFPTNPLFLISENKIASLIPEDLDSLRSPNSAGSLAKASFPCSSSCLAHGNPRLPGWKWRWWTSWHGNVRC